MDVGFSGDVVPSAKKRKSRSKNAGRKAKARTVPIESAEDLAARQQQAAVHQQQVEARIASLQAILDAAETAPPTLKAPEAPEPAQPLRSAARDVYYFMAPVDTNAEVKPEHLEATTEHDIAYQASLTFDTIRRPKTEYLRCICCL